jgi:L-serine dehydratase
MKYSFGEAFIRDAHPNTVVITATGVSGTVRTIEAASVGGGSIRVIKIDDMEANFTGDYPTLLIRNLDKPGMVLKIVSKMNEFNINIANLVLSKDMKNKGTAITVIECDDVIPFAMVDEIRSWEEISRVLYLYNEDMVISEETQKRLDEYNERKYREMKELRGE